MSKSSRKPVLTTAGGAAMRGVPLEILRPCIENFLRCDKEYGTRIAEKVGMRL